MKTEGRNAVIELLKTGKNIDKLLLEKGAQGSISIIFAEARKKNIRVQFVDKQVLDKESETRRHQGVIAYTTDYEYYDLDDIIADKKSEKGGFIVLCDGVTDPYNLGAIIRCAECCGAHGLIIPKRRASGLTPLVTKASAGAIEHLAVAKVANITNAVEQLKRENVWVYAAEAGGPSIYESNFEGPCAIVMGSEGNGVSQGVRKACDGIISIPIYGQVNSFNVSAATAIILAEVARQHHKN